MGDEAIHEQWEESPFAESHVTGNVIHNVKLLGKISKNKREYSEQAMKDATRLYENVAFYFDHPPPKELRERGGVRSVTDLGGKVRNPRRLAGEVRGDVQMLNVPEAAFNPKAWLTAFAEQMPDMGGFSHRATGRIKPGKDGANDVVESLAHVSAVELVTEPATTAGLFESLQDQPIEEEESEMEFKDITLESLTANRPDLLKAVTDGIQESAETKAMKEELTTLKDEKELREKADAKRSHKDLADKLLKEAKLPEAIVTETFKEQLHGAKDEAAIVALLDDRKLLVKSMKPKGPRSTERTVEEAFKKDDKDAPVDDDMMEAALTTLEVI